MASKSRFEKFKNIVSALISPKGPSAQASDIPESFMGDRKKKLDGMGGKNMGGMFDIIYKKKKERETSLKEIDY